MPLLDSMIPPGHEYLASHPLDPFSAGLDEDLKRAAGYVPRDAPSFMGMVPTWWQEEEERLQRELEAWGPQPPLGQEEHPGRARAFQNLTMHQAQRKQVERKYAKDFERFQASGLKPSEFADREFMEKYDPNGWRENFFLSTLDTIVDETIFKRGGALLEMVGATDEAQKVADIADRNDQVRALRDFYADHPTFRKHARAIVGSTSKFLSAWGSGAAGVIADAAATSYAGAIGDARRNGLSPTDAYSYAIANASIEGGITAALSRLGFGGLEAGRFGLSRSFLRGVAEEIPEEVMITAAQEWLHGKFFDPKYATMERMQQSILDTIIQTAGTVGLASVARRVGNAFTDDPDDMAFEVPREPPPQPTPTPTPTAPQAAAAAPASSEAPAPQAAKPAQPTGGITPRGVDIDASSPTEPLPREERYVRDPDVEEAEDAAAWMARNRPEEAAKFVRSRKLISDEDFQKMGFDPTPGSKGANYRARVRAKLREFVQEVHRRGTEMNEERSRNEERAAAYRETQVEVKLLEGYAKTRPDNSEVDAVTTDAPLTGERSERSAESVGFVPKGFKMGREKDSARHSFEDAETEARWRGAKRPTRQGLLSLAKEAFSQVKRGFTVRPDLPNTPENAVYHRMFQRINESQQIATEEAVRRIAEIAQPLNGNNDLDLGYRVLALRDMIAQREQGEDFPLLYGFKDMQQARKELNRAEQAAMKNPAINNDTPGKEGFLQRHAAKQRELVKGLVAIGRLPDEALNNDSYRHREIIFYMKAQGSAPGGLKSRVYGFQKPRETTEGGADRGPEKDAISDYIAAELAWTVDALHAIRLSTINTDLARKSLEITEDLQRTAEARGVDWREVMEEDGYEEDVIGPGHLFYMSRTLPEKALAHVLDWYAGRIAESDLSDAEKTFAMQYGLGQRPLVLPSGVWSELRKLQKHKEERLLPFLNKVNSTWKRWILLNPTHAAIYNLVNQASDADPVVGAIPSALAPENMKHATKTLWDFFSSNRPIERMPADFQAAWDEGVVASSLTSTEFMKLRAAPAFARFRESRRTPWTAYFDMASNVTGMRENILRYAVFRRYKQLLDGKGIVDYGASKRDVINALHKEKGSAAAAAMLTKNLMINYADTSQLGQWLSATFIPYYRFQAGNLKRYTRMFANVGDRKYAKGAVTARAIGAAIGLRRGAFLATVIAYNLLFHGDEEEELSKDDRASPHLVLGRNEDGSINLWRNFGALGDVVEWLGLNEAAALSSLYLNEQISGSDLLSESGLSIVNKLVNMVGPVKGGVETMIGQSLWPDAFNPRSVDRWEHAAGVVGLMDEFRYLKGAAQQVQTATGIPIATMAEDFLKISRMAGSRPREHYWQQYLAAVTDPRHNALSESYDLVHRFEQSVLGNEDSGNFGISKYRNLRYAAAAKDYMAYKEALDKIKRDDPKFSWKRNYQKFIDRIDPTSGLSRADRLRFEREYLTDVQKQRLAVAKDYSKEIRSTLVTYWGRYHKK